MGRQPETHDDDRRVSMPTGRDPHATLEDRARSIIGEGRSLPRNAMVGLPKGQARLEAHVNSPPLTLVRHQIASVLARIDGLREHVEAVQTDLRDQDCEVGTELLRLESCASRYTDDTRAERHSLQRERRRVRAEQRRVGEGLEERMDGLIRQLVELVQTYTLLSPSGWRERGPGRELGQGDDPRQSRTPPRQ